MTEQTARIDGSHNIVVQATGSTVTVGVAHLTLVPRHRRRRAAKGDIDLLNPFTDAIPFIGRTMEMDRLETWLTSPAPISVRCLTGRAGTGKTRLVLELCGRAEKRQPPWHAGFVEHRELDRFGPTEPQRLGLATPDPDRRRLRLGGDARAQAVAGGVG